MIRKIVQMATDSDGYVFVLCNDGTLWALSGSGAWTELPPIPQDESKDPLAKLYAKNVDAKEKLDKAGKKLTCIADWANKAIQSSDLTRHRIAAHMLNIIRPEPK